MSSRDSVMILVGTGQYKERKYEINESSHSTVKEIKAIEDEIANKPSLPLEELVGDVIKLVEDLDFAEKKEIVQKVVTKVVATKEEVSVWGRIPVLATEKVSLDVKYSDSSVSTQSNISSNPSDIGLNVKYRHIKVLTQLPFELKLRMPSTDRGGRGYSDEYITTIEETLYI